MISKDEIARALETAQKCTRAASEISLRYFSGDLGGDLGLETKADDSPVTRADRASEAAILEILRAAHPDHSILTEESGAHGGRADRRWIIDPLDGTRGFSRGGVFWGPLVALEADGEIVVGATALPARSVSYFAARDMGAFRDGTRLSLSTLADWQKATVSMGELHKLLRPDIASAIIDLGTRCASTRAYGDVGSCAMLLDGTADVWLETGVQIWDIAPFKVLVEESGGIFTDFNGKNTILSGQVIAANPSLHHHALDRFHFNVIENASR